MLGTGRGQKDRARAVDQEGAQVGITAFGNGAQVLAKSAGVFPWDDAEGACESPAGAEAGEVADKGGESRGCEKANTGDGKVPGGRRARASGCGELALEVLDFLFESTDFGGDGQQGRVK